MPHIDQATKNRNTPRLDSAGCLSAPIRNFSNAPGVTGQVTFADQYWLRKSDRAAGRHVEPMRDPVVAVIH